VLPPVAPPLYPITSLLPHAQIISFCLHAVHSFQTYTDSVGDGDAVTSYITLRLQ